jgi:excinuclease ABC subunit A
MNFLPDVYVPCEVCKGARFNRETLEVHYKGKNIAEVLDTTIEEAAVFFEAIGPIHRHLKTLAEVGLGYVRLGQPAPTLSGGEAQRVKLAAELQKRSTGRTVYVLDEPTTGLHFADVEKLLGVINGLVDKGNTVIVIEHNLDVIKTADHVIDMGPEGGSGGGMVIAEGTPEEVAAEPASYTGQFLQPILAGRAARTAADLGADLDRLVDDRPAARQREVTARNGSSGASTTTPSKPAARTAAATTTAGRKTATKTTPTKAAATRTAGAAKPAAVNGGAKRSAGTNGTTTVAPAQNAATKARRKAAKLM